MLQIKKMVCLSRHSFGEIIVVNLKIRASEASEE